MSRPITYELSRGDLSPYLTAINTSWRIMHIWKVGSDTLAEATIEACSSRRRKTGWRAATNACKQSSLHKDNVLHMQGQSASVWLLCLR